MADGAVIMDDGGDGVRGWGIDATPNLALHTKPSFEELNGLDSEPPRAFVPLGVLKELKVTGDGSLLKTVPRMTRLVIRAENESIAFTVRGNFLDIEPSKPMVKLFFDSKFVYVLPNSGGVTDVHIDDFDNVQRPTGTSVMQISMDIR